MSSTFIDLGVDAKIAARLAENGVTTPFDIQAQTIPAALEGKDVCGRAPTGSGKTLAFGIPLAQRVGRASVAKPKALVLAPTRELAAQIERELAPILRVRGRSVASFYGGTSFTPQLKVLRRGVDVAVACPGRLADLVNRGVLRLEEVEIVVIDEADRMADMGFLPEVRRILDRVRSDRQTLLFSATLDGDVDVLIRNYQREPHRAGVADASMEDDRRTHIFMDSVRDQRPKITAQLADEHGSTVVFCRTKHGTDRLAKQLTAAGVNAVAIHGDRSQSQRERALASFTKGQAQVLVATDVAARGIHVDDVACVVHYDLPADIKDYVHRSGRTGRAGAAGVVVTLVTDTDRNAARTLQRAVETGDQNAKMPKIARGGGGGGGGGQSRGGQGRGGQSRGGQSQSRGATGGAARSGARRTGGASSFGGGERRDFEGRPARSGAGAPRGRRSASGSNRRAS